MCVHIHAVKSSMHVNRFNNDVFSNSPLNDIVQGS